VKMLRDLHDQYSTSDIFSPPTRCVIFQEHRLRLVAELVRDRGGEDAWVAAKKAVRELIRLANMSVAHDRYFEYGTFPERALRFLDSL